MQLSLLLLTGWIPLGVPPEAVARSVDFAVPAPCGTSVEFFETLEREHAIAASDLTFQQVRLEAEGSSFRLDWVDALGTRTFRDGDCRTLFRTAVVIAVSSMREAEAAALPGPATAEPKAAEPAAGAAALTAVPLPAPRTDPPAPTDSPEKVAPLIPEVPVPRDEQSQGTTNRVAHSSKRRPIQLRGEGGFAVGGAVSLFPNPAVFAEFSGGLFVGPAGASLSLRYLPRSTANPSDSFGIQLEAWAGRLGVAYEPIDWFRADLGLGVTSLIGTGTGVRNPEKDGVWLFAPELDLSGRLFSSGPFALDLGVRAWVAINTPRFEIDGEGEIYRVPPAGGALFLRGRVHSR